MPAFATCDCSLTSWGRFATAVPISVTLASKLPRFESMEGSLWSLGSIFFNTFVAVSSFMDSKVSVALSADSMKFFWCSRLVSSLAFKSSTFFSKTSLSCNSEAALVSAITALSLMFSTSSSNVSTCFCSSGLEFPVPRPGGQLPGITG